MKKSVFFLCLLLFTSCAKQPSFDNALDAALASSNEKIRRVMDGLEQHQVQIRFTQIDREGDSLVFTDYDFQVNSDNYFYPASTVKFPAAVTALEKLNELDSLHRDVTFYIEGDSVETTFARAIEEIFAVSDNDANNRLVEFLGFDDLNQRIGNKGTVPIRISHRLSTSNADDVTTKPLVIYKNDSSTVVSQPVVSSPPAKLTLKNIKKGKGFYVGDSLYNEPFDFGLKNYYPVTAQHEVLKRVLFPKIFDQDERFTLSEDQHDFLLESMSALPYQAGYDRLEYYDGYVKFFMFGDSKEPIPEHIKIYNKVGYAYGTLTDCAYIKDIKNNVDFMITATILVNKDGIFNDDNYEYDEIGIPFLAQLGREIYAYELKR
ncbi:MAG: serine hydrolase [Bacteroidota bacterium]